MYKNGSGIILLTLVDMPLKRNTPNQPINTHGLTHHIKSPEKIVLARSNRVGARTLILATGHSRIRTHTHTHTHTHTYIYIYIYISKVSRLHLRANRMFPFPTARTPKYGGGHYSFPWITPHIFYLDLITLGVKQRIK